MINTELNQTKAVLIRIMKDLSISAGINDSKICALKAEGSLLNFNCDQVSSAVHNSMNVFLCFKYCSGCIFGVEINLVD